MSCGTWEMDQLALQAMFFHRLIALALLVGGVVWLISAVCVGLWLRKRHSENNELF